MFGLYLDDDLEAHSRNTVFLFNITLSGLCIISHQMTQPFTDYYLERSVSAALVHTRRWCECTHIRLMASRWWGQSCFCTGLSASFHLLCSQFPPVTFTRQKVPNPDLPHTCFGSLLGLFLDYSRVKGQLMRHIPSTVSGRGVWKTNQRWGQTSKPKHTH